MLLSNMTFIGTTSLCIYVIPMTTKKIKDIPLRFIIVYSCKTIKAVIILASFPNTVKNVSVTHLSIPRRAHGEEDVGPEFGMMF